MSCAQKSRKEVRGLTKPRGVEAAMTGGLGVTNGDGDGEDDEDHVSWVLAES